jgi:glutamyl/glutaminyl-tRNA synthetase
LIPPAFRLWLTLFECSTLDVATNLAQFEKLLKGEETEWCMRAKIDMKSVNGCLRDPVMYRFNADPHHITGTKYAPSLFLDCRQQMRTMHHATLCHVDDLLCCVLALAAGTRRIPRTTSRARL